MKRLALPPLALLALAACGGPEPEPVPEETAAPAPPGTQAPEVTETEAVPTAIPAALQGRWGLVEADCEPGRMDAKGLMTIGPERLEFYESVGTLRDIAEGGSQRIRATFDFTGEGMNWERDMALELQDGGEALVRREYGEDAAPEPLRYGKCG